MAEIDYLWKTCTSFYHCLLLEWSVLEWEDNTLQDNTCSHVLLRCITVRWDSDTRRWEWEGWLCQFLSYNASEIFCSLTYRFVWHCVAESAFNKNCWNREKSESLEVAGNYIKPPIKFLTWNTRILPLSHNSWTTTNSHIPLYVCTVQIVLNAHLPFTQYVLS